MSREPSVSSAEPKIPRRRLQFSLRTLFFAVLTLGMVLGVGYTTRAMSGSLKFGLVSAGVAALVAWFVWIDRIFCSPRITLATSLVWFGIAWFLVLPAITHLDSPHDGRVWQCKTQMRHITLALLNYESQHGEFPPAYTFDAEGNRLHSWRTLILPQLEYVRTYSEIDLNQPWDAPANSAGVANVLGVYQCPSHPDCGKQPFTSYVAVTGPGTMWPGEESRMYAELGAAAGKVVLIVEISRSDIAWAEPRDLTVDEVIEAFRAGELTGISSYHEAGANFAFANGVVRTIDPATLTEAELRAMFTIGGGEEEDAP